MSSHPVKRKLAAILAADAVGYSKAMSADEEGTMKVLSAHRAVIDGIIEFHEGRIINTAGDSVLAEFVSPVQAVRCAVEMQDALKTRNDALPEDRRLHFRIGVNLGDVMVKGDDLLGDGVNVAARLEGIAEPGNIYVSSSVYDQIAGKLDLGFVDLGDQELKNIDRPIRTYRIDREGRKTVSGARKRKGAPVWLPAGIGALVVAAGFFGYQEFRKAEDEKAKTAAAAAAVEIAKARAEADEARRKAAVASDAADQAKRALDEQRVKESQARAQAELAKARADAEATRRKADQELAAATEARRSAEAAVKDAEAKAAAAKRAAESQKDLSAKTKPSSPYAGDWTAFMECKEFAGTPPFQWSQPVKVGAQTGNFEVIRGEKEKPGYLAMNGVPQLDGRMQVNGAGIAGVKAFYGKPYAASFDGRFAQGKWEGAGKLGLRECKLAFTRGVAPAAKK